DLDHSYLDEKPKGRKPVKTLIAHEEKIEALIARIRERARDMQIFWVCPLIEESEQQQMVSALERFESLKVSFAPEEIVLLHGRMKPTQRAQAMQAFTSGQARVMVATTIIEVGVDIPAAGIMVIEHAERFGLAQLHQLRGRIGRGSDSAYCVLLYHGRLSSVQTQRLEAIRAHDDGFLIAEEDWRLRGSGDVLGTRQSGVPEFRFVDVAIHRDVMAMARRDAQRIFAEDPELTGAKGEGLRTLLYLFSEGEAIDRLWAG
ncbi:MAG: helicase-related protein, partial [Pseudomonadota bacterium]